MKNVDFDLIVIGGGSGGVAAARNASQHGAKTLLIEKNKLGGTCVNAGCVPKKIYWNAAELASAIKLAPSYGLEVPHKAVHWPTLNQKMKDYISGLNESYKNKLEVTGVTILFGHARFLSPHTVMVADQIFTSRYIIIATGGKPVRPTIAGAEHVITSDEFFELQQLPKRIAVVGSGYIAVELAGVIAGNNERIDLVLRGTHLLRQFDSDVGLILRQQMGTSGIRIHTNSEPQSIRKTRQGLTITTPKGELGHFDSIIWATGRSANFDGLDLQKAGLKPDERGFIASDEQSNTEKEHIFAIGDVGGRAALTPLAIAAGRRLTNRLFKPEKAIPMSYDQIPTVVFSHPPIATVGISEEQAQKSYPNQIKVYKARFTSMLHALSHSKPTTLFKLVAYGSEEKIIGCHLVGDRVDEMIQGVAIAIRMGATKKDFDRTLAIHPTIAEELVTMT